MSFLVIDGSQGEGGGQVLRTALTLSILTKTPIELVNIRANRNRPGLLRQHLTSVKAAQEISSAKTEGVELGAKRIRFSPGDVKPGNYHFVIGTAGSTVLVCQTILPVLMLADASSIVTFEGGTHNGMSPSLCFLEHSYLPVLKMMGVECKINVNKLGFYPAGGGKWQLTVAPVSSLKRVHLLEAREPTHLLNGRCKMKAIVSLLSETIGEREISTARKILGWDHAEEVIKNVATPGPGNSFQLSIEGDFHASVFEVVGELGVSAERVAKRCAGRVKKFIEAQAAVEEHLADQLLIPMVLAGGGSFTTVKPSLHTKTNIEVIKLFLNLKIKSEQENKQGWKITVGSE